MYTIIGLGQAGCNIAEMFETSPKVDILIRIDDLLCFKSKIFDKSYFHFISKNIPDFWIICNYFIII